jgi:hypothetical protein
LILQGLAGCGYGLSRNDVLLNPLNLRA